MEIAKRIKGCHFYYYNPIDHCLYGVPEDAFCIKSIPLPQAVQATGSFYFRVDTVDHDIVSNYVDFVIPFDAPWAAIPLTNRPDLPTYCVRWHPVDDTCLWAIAQGRTIVPYLNLLAPDTDKYTPFRKVRQLVEGYVMTRHMAGPSYAFPHMERHPVIIDICSNKVSAGEKFLPLWVNEKSYGVIIFKQIFSLNKGDALTVYVNDKLDVPNVFEVHFEVAHCKNPIKYIIDDFTVTTHVAAIRVN